MNDDQKCCQATPAGTLEAVFMNCNTPLSEREHWARNEIEQLKADRDVWRQKAIELWLEVSAADKLLKQCKEALALDCQTFPASKTFSTSITALAAIEKELGNE